MPRSSYRPRHAAARRGLVAVVATALGLTREPGRVLSILDVLAREEACDEA